MKQMEFPGEELRARREAMGLSVADVFEQTRIPTRYIRSLEECELRYLPEPCYVAGFLKTYCEFLSLEPKRFINSYSALMRPSMTFFRRSKEFRIRNTTWMADVMSWATITAILLFMWFAYGMVVHPKTTPLDQRVDAKTVEVVQPAQEPAITDLDY